MQGEVAPAPEKKVAIFNASGVHFLKIHDMVLMNQDHLARIRDAAQAVLDLIPRKEE